MAALAHTLGRTLGRTLGHALGRAALRALGLALLADFDEALDQLQVERAARTHLGAALRHVDAERRALRGEVARLATRPCGCACPDPLDTYRRNAGFN